jgi:hypothetical protein
MNPNLYLDGFDSNSSMEVEIWVDTSIYERYDGPLDRFEDLHGQILYQPIDTDHVVQLLVDLWGHLLTPEAINEAFDRLMTPDLWGRWPHGYCEADEAERPLSSYDEGEPLAEV